MNKFGMTLPTFFQFVLFLKRKRHFSFYKTCFDIPMSSSVANFRRFHCIHEHVIAEPHTHIGKKSKPMN